MQEQLQLPGFSRQNIRKLIIQLVDIWFLKYTKSKKIHYYYDEIAYACLLVHNSFSPTSDNAEDSFEAYWKIKKLIERLDEDNAFWIVKLPWKLMIPTHDSFDELILNLDHHSSAVRLWMMHLAWVVKKSLYKDEVLPPSIKARVSIEAGIAQGWRDYVGDNGASISLEHYGASAGANVLFDKFGFNVANVIKTVKKVLA
jgi:hypothetical protein